MTRDAEHTPSPQSVGRLKLTDRVVLGDVLRARKSFTNPDILTKGDVVIVQAATDDGCVYFQNLFRCSPQAGLRLDWFDFVHRPPTRLKADYSHMSAAPAPSSLAGGARERIKTILDEETTVGGTSASRSGAVNSDELAGLILAALSPEAPAREVTAFAMNGPMTTHPTLRSANIARQDEWDQDGQITASYRGNELAGEVGEACNVIKKLERERLGILGSRATVGELADELADVLICADLIAMHYGIDLEAAVARKFNATSEKVGLLTRLAGPNDGGGS